MRALRFLLESRSLAPLLRTQQLRRLSLCCRALRPFEGQITTLRPRAAHEPRSARLAKMRFEIADWVVAMRERRQGEEKVAAGLLSLLATRAHAARQARRERGWDRFLEALCAGRCPQLEELDFSVVWVDACWRATLSAAPALRLAQGLRFPPSLRVLNLNCSPLGSAGAAALVEGLRFTPRLQVLSLYRTQIGDGGMLALTPVLPKLPELRHLDVGFCRLTYVSLTALGAHLRYLQQLRFLDISGCGGLLRLKAAHDDILHALRHLPRLESLFMSGCWLRDEGALVLAEALCYLPRLRALFLYRCHLGDEGIQALTAMLPFVPRLQQLHVGGNEVSAESNAMLQEVAARQGLKSLSTYVKGSTKNVDRHERPCCSDMLGRRGLLVSKDAIVSRGECCRGRYV